MDFNKEVCQEVINKDTVVISNKIDSLLFISECDTIKNSIYNYCNYIFEAKVFDLSSNSLIQIIYDTLDYCIPPLKFVDINFDNYLDVEISDGHTNLVSNYSFWIYDSIKSCFIHSEEFSSLNDYTVDYENQIIESYAQFMGGRGGLMEKYRIRDGHLSLIESEYSNRNNFEHKETINGVLRTTQLTEEDWIEDDEGNSIIVINCYSFIHDSLLLTEINWLTNVNENISEDMYSSDIYNCGPWGECLKYLRQEVYSYDTNYNVIETKKYLVINDQWEEVNSFK